MAATIQIHEMTASAAGVDKTGGTVRFKSADVTTVDTNDRVNIPPAGTNYSYTKQLRFNFNTAPSVDIRNLRAYSDGVNSFGTGVGIQYDVPIGGLGAFPNINTTIGGTDFFTTNSVSPIYLDTINTGPYTGIGYKGDILRIQLTVASTAGPGQLTPELLTFSYDET